MRKALGLIFFGTFNRALCRRDTNAVFRKLEALIEYPETISEQTVEEFAKDKENITKSWFWWFYNPLGKIARGMGSVVYPEQMLRFYFKKEELRKTLSQLLTQPLD